LVSAPRRWRWNGFGAARHAHSDEITQFLAAGDEAS
jgi:hypothetical protein